MPKLTPTATILLQRQRACAQRKTKPYEQRDPLTTLTQNLFRDLHPATLHEYQEGDGAELDDKIRALHSSAALVCNVFDYWRDTTAHLAPCLGLPSNEALRIRFEQKVPIFDDASS